MLSFQVVDSASANRPDSMWLILDYAFPFRYPSEINEILVCKLIQVMRYGRIGKFEIGINKVTVSRRAVVINEDQKKPGGWCN